MTGDGALVRAGVATYAVGLLALPAANSVLGVAGAAAVVGAGVGLVLPSVDAGLSASVSRDLRAGALSLRNSVTFLGRAAGPVAFAAAAGAAGYDPLLRASGALALSVAALAAIAARLRR